MSQSYMNCTFSVKVRNDEERDWLKSRYDSVVACCYCDHDEHDVRNVTELGLHYYEDEFWGWDRQIDGNTFTFTCDENANIDLMCMLIKAYLERFDVRRPVGFEWAITHPRMEEGEMGGGACFITQTKIKTMSTLDWLTQHFKDWKATRE